MEQRKIHRRVKGTHISFRQKRKLIEFVSKHPELITCKVTPEFSYSDSQSLWQTIATACNAIPGSKKTWRQWRKTWQDLRSKSKKRKELQGLFPPSYAMLEPAELEALGLKANLSTEQENTEHQTPEFVTLEEQIGEENNFHSEMEESEPESPPEPKVFTKRYNTRDKNNKYKNSSKHSNDCVFNCDLLAVHERKKLELKEDYINFKKDYLSQKLKIMKEQTEALKAIARELGEK